MAEPTQNSGQKHVSFVPNDTSMREFTVRALILGLLMCVILGAANQVQQSQKTTVALEQPGGQI